MFVLSVPRSSHESMSVWRNMLFVTVQSHSHSSTLTRKLERQRKEEENVNSRERSIVVQFGTPQSSSNSHLTCLPSNHSALSRHRPPPPPFHQTNHSPLSLSLSLSLSLTSFKLPLAATPPRASVHAPRPPAMAAAAVTSPSPDPFTFHCPAAPSVAPEADGDEFEFHVVPAALSAADELFSGGKLVPLLRPAPASAPCSPPPCLEEVVEPASASASEPTSPRAPRCAGRRWRDLLHLLSSSKKAKDGNKCGDGCLKLRDTHFRPLLSRDSSSSSSASSVESRSKHAHGRPPPPSSCSPLRTRSAPVASLLHLMSRTTRSAADASLMHLSKRQEETAYAAAHPLLTRASSSSSSASSSDSGRNPRAAVAPWRPRGPSHRRPAVAAESPRVSASGRVVFRGLERCSSTPASAGIGGARRPRPRGMERSYSANVRVDPVINVFGFGLLFMPSSPAKERKSDKEKDGAGRRTRPEKLAMVLRDPQD
ncbi:hypothetical protein HU200_064189 [Digitaria exilis]|uniref:Uncharacterized protein n=1 Tax=Digitaria exilis TaxID=1010633 RepID=A0A835AC14_9POAL|nr:hypothetical protein HU200_064189 [Digitaria exilis]